MKKSRLLFERGFQYDLEDRRTVIGRDRSCDIILKDDSVSGFHAEILLEGDHFELVDLGSTNGTFLDGQRVQGRVALQPWQRIRFGDVECEVVDTEARRPTGVFQAVPDEQVATSPSEHQARGKACLILVSAGNHPERVVIGDSVSVGRTAQCDLTLDDEMVSGQHARLAWRGDGFELIDLQSTNGTFVNDKRVQRHSLRHGDRVRFDEIEYRFLMSEENPGEISERELQVEPAQPDDESLEEQSAEDRHQDSSTEWPEPTSQALDEPQVGDQADESETLATDDAAEQSELERPPTPLPDQSIDKGEAGPVRAETSAQSEDKEAFSATEDPDESNSLAAQTDGDDDQADATRTEENVSPSTDPSAVPSNAAPPASDLRADGGAITFPEDPNRSGPGEPDPSPTHPLNRAWHFLWRRNVLRPSIRILRWLIILSTIAAALLLISEVVVPSWSQHPALGAILFLGLALLLWLLFAIAMVVPDLISIVMRIEQTCALKSGHGLGSRYPALRAWSGWLRLLAIAWLSVIVANLLLVPLTAALTTGGGSGAYETQHIWLMVTGILSALLTGGYLFWQRFVQGGLGQVGLLPVVWLGVGAGAALMWYEGLFHLAVPLMSSVWLLAGLYAIVSLFRTPMTICPGKIWQCFAVLFLLAWLLVLRGDMLTNLTRLPFIAILLLSDEADVAMLFQIAREFAGGAGIALLVIAVVLRAFVYWLGSDFLRSLTRGVDGLVLRLGHAGRGGIHARFVTVCLRVFTILATLLLVILLLEPPVSHHRLWYFDFAPLHQWGLPSTLVGMFALVAFSLVVIWSYRELLLATYDLREATNHVASDTKPMDLTSLRVIYGLGMFLAAVGAVVALFVAGRFMLAALDRGGLEPLIMALGVLAGSAFVILVVTLPLMILRNLLDIEARTRPDRASAVTVSASYPGLSTVAGIGKFMAVLVAILAGLATTALVLVAALAEQGGLMFAAGVGGVFCTIVLYWLFSLIPDLVRLTLTLERNLCDPRGSVQQFLAGHMHGQNEQNSAHSEKPS